MRVRRRVPLAHGDAASRLVEKRGARIRGVSCQPGFGEHGIPPSLTDARMMESAIRRTPALAPVFDHNSCLTDVHTEISELPSNKRSGAPIGAGYPPVLHATCRSTYDRRTGSADGRDGMGDVAGVIRALGKLVFLLQGAGHRIAPVHRGAGTGRPGGDHSECVF